MGITCSSRRMGKNAEFLSENLRKINHLEDVCLGIWSVKIKWKKYVSKPCVIIHFMVLSVVRS